MKLNLVVAVVGLAVGFNALAAPKLLGVKDTDRTKHKYIIMFKDSVSGTIDDLAADMKSDNVKIKHKWDQALNAVSVYVEDDDITELENNPNIALIEAVKPLTPTITRLRDRIDQRELPLDNTYNVTNDGTGVDIYIWDTGVRTSHSEFGGRADTVWQVDSSCEYETSHGTAVASLAGGTNYGVASNANIHSMMIYTCSGGADTSYLLDAANWLIKHHTKGDPAVVNISSAFSGSSSSISTAMKKLRSDGITVVAAAGNWNTDACNYTPAYLSNVITVGATTIFDSRASYSNYGTCIDIWAPAEGLTYALAGNDSQYAASDGGTSLAAPVVAGVAALYLQDEPSATPAEVWARIKGTATYDLITDVDDSPNRFLFAINSDDEIPDTPELPTAEDLCGGLYNISWDAVSGADTYQLFKSSNNDFSEESLIYTGSGKSKNVGVSGTKYFRVRACSGDVCSPFSQQRGVTYSSGSICL